jgi:hypothetical protein
MVFILSRNDAVSPQHDLGGVELASVVKQTEQEAVNSEPRKIPRPTVFAAAQHDASADPAAASPLITSA